MKTLKYILLGVMLSSLLLSSFNLFSSKRNPVQSSKLTFCETYTQQQLISGLDATGCFFNLIHMEGTDAESSLIGSCFESDLTDLMECIRNDSFQESVPEDLLVIPGNEAVNGMIPLYAIRRSATDNRFPLKQDLKEVSVRKGDHEGDYSLYISFNGSGAEKWAAMTRVNIGKDIAILYNGKVIASPRVREEIKNGNCMISGKFTGDEINDLKSALEK
jgi:hypothetical protein